VALNSAADNVRQSADNVRQGVVGQESTPPEAPADQELAAAPAGQHVTRSALTGVGLLVGANLLAVAVGTTTGWWGLFEYGWPAELLLVAILLSLVMGALGEIWMLVPVGILVGNGFIMAYCSLTGNWAAWGFLWLVELLLVGGVIILSVNLSRKHADAGRSLAHHLGMPVALLSGLFLVFIGFGSILASIFHRMFP